MSTEPETTAQAQALIASSSLGVHTHGTQWVVTHIASAMIADSPPRDRWSRSGQIHRLGDAARCLRAVWHIAAYIALGAIIACSRDVPEDQATGPPSRPALARIVINPAVATVQAGDTVRFTAVGIDALDQPLSSGIVFQWSVSDTSLATVSPAGVVLGRAVGGPIRVSATAQSKAGGADLTVMDPLGMLLDLKPAGYEGDSITAVTPAGSRTIRIGVRSAVPLAAMPVQPLAFFTKAGEPAGMTLITRENGAPELLIEPGPEANLLVSAFGSYVASARSIQQFHEVVTTLRASRCYPSVLSQFTAASQGAHPFRALADTNVVNAVMACFAVALGPSATLRPRHERDGEFRAQSALALQPFVGIRTWLDSPNERVGLENFGARLFAVERLANGASQPSVLSRGQFRLLIPERWLLGGLSNSISGGIFDHLVNGGTTYLQHDALSPSEQALGVEYCLVGFGRLAGDTCPFFIDRDALVTRSMGWSAWEYLVLPHLETVADLIPGNVGPLLEGLLIGADFSFCLSRRLTECASAVWGVLDETLDLILADPNSAIKWGLLKVSKDAWLKAQLAVAWGNITFNMTNLALTYSTTQQVQRFSVTPPPATIGATPDQLHFSAPGGAGIPLAQVADLKNTGGGVLTGLTTGTIVYGQGEPSGWLAPPQLSATAAPAALSVRPSTTNLPAGVYHASIPIGATGRVTNSPLLLTIEYTVTAAPAPTINLSASTANFAATAGGANPPSQTTIQVTNSGTGTLTGLSVGTITYQAGHPSGWLSVSLSSTTAPATVTLAAVSGALSAGTYTAFVPIASSAPAVTNSPRTITVTFTVTAAPAPTINLSATTANFAVSSGGANPPSQNTIQVTNSGAGTLSGLNVGTVTYQAGQPTGWLSASLSSTTAPSSVTLFAVTRWLPAGTYTASVPIASTAPQVTNSPRPILVTFTVTPSGAFSRLFSSTYDGTAWTIDNCTSLLGSTARSVAVYWNGVLQGTAGTLPPPLACNSLQPAPTALFDHARTEAGNPPTLYWRMQLYDGPLLLGNPTGNLLGHAGMYWDGRMWYAER